MPNGRAAARMSGWTVFAGVFLAVAGLFNIIDGLVALFQKGYFNEGGLVYENLQFWGWIILIVGVIQLIAGWMIIGRSSAGRWLGLVVAALSMLVSFFAVGAYPWWAILTIVMDGIVIWGLTAAWQE